jgi:superfamily I DNA/RNA helicase
MLKQIYKTIIRDYNLAELSKVDLYNIIQSLIEDKYFLTNQEKEVETNIIHQHLLRYITYEKQLNRKILAKSVYGTIKMIGLGIDKDIELNADVVFDNPKYIEIVKFKIGATELSYKARTEKNLPENDMELYLLRKLGEQLYPNKPVISSFYHLKGKKDTKEIYAQFLSDKNELLKSLNELKGINYPDKKMQKEIEDVLYFNNSEGNNIISFNYDKSLDNEIIELLNTELTFNSEKCKSGNCDFCNYSTLCGYEDSNNDKLEIVKPTKKSNSKVKYTDAQKEIINAEFGNYRANCVAGSGKTSTVVARTIELFNKGYTIDDILMITFTNKGALELKDKIKKLKNINTDKLHIYTFNSFGESIVSKEWEALGFTQKPQLASSIDVNDIIKEMLQMDAYSRIEWLNYKNPLLNYPNAKGAFKQLQIYFNIIKSYGYNIDTFKNKILLKEKEQYENKAELIYEMYAKFNEMLKAKNLLQYQDQILYLIELLENNPNLINEYGFKHVIVDEYQDTDFTQVKLLHLLEKYNDFKSLMVVGDDGQAIYSFRNTTPENIINFNEQFENVKDIYLLDNFRSTPEICNLANGLIKLNTQRIDKDIISRKANGKQPTLTQYDTLENEYTGIIELTKEQIINNTPKHEICVIARTKKELLEIQSYLNKENIPSNIEASELFIDNINVQCIVNLANFFKNNEHDYYLMEYVFMTNPIESITHATEIDVITITSNVKNKIIEDFTLQESEESKIEYFYNLLAPLVENDDVAKSFVANLQTKTFFTFNQLLDYLYKVILYHDETNIEKDENKYDAVTLTTAHSSKGKEWSTVITTINSFKYEDIQTDLSLLEEERRLLFVDITRAKDELYITYNTSQDKSRNKGKYCLFADEINNILSVNE